MREKLEDGDAAPRRRRVFQILRDRIIDAQLAAFLKKKDARGGELLRERADPKPGSARVGDMPLKVCGTEGAISESTISRAFVGRS
jgi:hypothetical protein